MQVPPYSEDAEVSLLGSVLIDGGVLSEYAVAQVEPADFYIGSNQKIWEAYLSLKQKNLDAYAIDLVTVTEELRRRGHLEDAGGISYLIGLAERTPMAAYASQYARIVAEKSHLRKLIAHSAAVAKACYAQSMALEDIDALAASPPRAKAEEEDIVAGGSLLQSVIEQAQSGTGRRGASTGLRDLDDAMGGFEGTRLYVIGARPGMGKTAAAFQMAATIAQQGRVLGFSLEMPPEEIMTRLLCSEARVGLGDFTAAQRGRQALSAHSWQRLHEAKARLESLPLDIVKRQNVYLNELADMVRREHEKSPLSMFILDYLQLVRVKGRGGGNRAQEVGEISRELKTLALELQIPVLALSQLNRGVEERFDKRPMLSDLRESGSVEQDADVVMFIYRDEVYNQQTEERGIAEFIIGKQRNGPVSIVKTAYDAPLTRFSDTR